MNKFKLAQDCFKKLNPHIKSKEDLDYYFKPGNSLTITAFISGFEEAESTKYGTVDVPDEEFQDENIMVHVPFLKYKAMKARIAELESENEELRDRVDSLWQESMGDDL